MAEQLDSDLLFLRTEYENSGKTKSEFARFKKVDEWKMRYSLRKALQIRKRNKEVGFKKLNVVMPSFTDSGNDKILLIKTSYGAEISIPL